MDQVHPSSEQDTPCITKNLGEFSSNEINNLFPKAAGEKNITKNFKYYLMHIVI